MKVLAAIRESEGLRADRKGGCIDGELVWMVEPCPLSLNYPQGPCACARTFRGMFTDEVTTMAVVNDIAGMTRADYIAAMTACHGSRPDCTCDIDPTEVVDDLIRQIRGYPEGTVFTRLIDLVDVNEL